MGDDILPEDLFHYTSMQNLAIILSTKSIRFSRADMVNDLEELRINDLPKMKKAVYISC